MKIYIIMPVGTDPKYEEKKHIIKSSVTNLKINFHFPNYSKIKSKFNLDSTLHDIQTSTLILADLSRERPSCYYELGLVQAIGKKVYIIAEKGTPIHQLYGREHVHFYDGLSELKILISNMINFDLLQKK